jgi:hypothetical protein
MTKYILHILRWFFVIHNTTAQLTPSQYANIDKKIIAGLFTEGKLYGGILFAEGENVIYNNAAKFLKLKE